MVVLWTLASLACLVASMAGIAIDRSGDAQASATNLADLRPFWMAQASAWAALTALWLVAARRDDTASHSARRFACIAAFIVTVGVIARGGVLLLHEPTLSDDIHRYIFDGRNFAAGVNPYLIRPDEAAGDGIERWPGEERLLEQMPHPSFTTPYLPLSQYVFRAMGKMIGDAAWAPERCARLFRIGFVIVELGLIAALTNALRRARRSPWYLALYAWHPLPITEVAGSGHQDILGIALMVAALLVFEARRAHLWAWSALVAMAVLVKPVAALAGLMMLRGRPALEWLQAAVFSVATASLLIAPVWLLPESGPAAFTKWRGTAQEMTAKWAHFGGAYEPVLFIVRKALPDGPQREAGFNLVQEWVARKICASVFLIAIAVIFLSRADHWRRTAAVLLALTILTTTAHPWYLLWALALAPLAMSWTLWVFSLTISWGYIVFVSGKGWAGGEVWTVEPWVIAAAYVPVLAALAVDLSLHWRTRRCAHAKPQTAKRARDC